MTVAQSLAAHGASRLAHVIGRFVCGLPEAVVDDGLICSAGADGVTVGVTIICGVHAVSMRNDMLIGRASNRRNSIGPFYHAVQLRLPLKQREFRIRDSFSATRKVPAVR